MYRIFLWEIAQPNSQLCSYAIGIQTNTSMSNVASSQRASLMLLLQRGAGSGQRHELTPNAVLP